VELRRPQRRHNNLQGSNLLLPRPILRSSSN
jgi:hypothetical protein